MNTKRHESLAQAIELEERVIVAVKCMKCNAVVSAYGYSEHTCGERDTQDTLHTIISGNQNWQDWSESLR